MALFNRESGRGNAAVSEKAFRTDGFQGFWEKFEDAHNISPEDQDYEQVVGQRFEAFKKLPEVTKAIQELAVEKNSIRLGKGFTEQELATVAQELENIVTRDKNFAMLETLSVQVEKFRRLPNEIAQLQSNLISLGDRESLEHEEMGLNHKIARKESKISEAESTHEGMTLAKEGVATVKGLEKGLDLAEQVFVRETEVAVDNYNRSFSQLEAAGQKIAEADRNSPPPSIALPEFSGLKRSLQEAESKKSNPADYLELLASLNFGSRLEGLQKEIRQAVDGKLAALAKLQGKKRESKQYPELPEFIAKFREARNEVLAVNIDKSWDRQVEDLQNDLIQVVGVRQGLGYLEGDPANRRMKLMVDQSIGDFQTATGRQMALRLKAGLVELGEIQGKLDQSPVSGNDVRIAVDHSRKGIMRRLITRDPIKKMKKNAEAAARDIEVMEAEKEQISRTITNIGSAERELGRVKDEFDMARNNLLSKVKSFQALFKNAAVEATLAINIQSESENIGEFLKAELAANKLAAAREADPELYGAMDTDEDNLDTSFYGEQNLRGFQEKFLEKLQAKVAVQVRRALESLTGNEVKPDSLAVKLKAFEDGLGSIAKTPQYQAVRLKAFREVTYDPGFPVGKKSVLAQMLYEARNGGFMPGGVLDLTSYIAAGSGRNRAAA